MPGLAELRLPSAVALVAGWLSLTAALAQTPAPSEPLPAPVPPGAAPETPAQPAEPAAPAGPAPAQASPAQGAAAEAAPPSNDAVAPAAAPAVAGARWRFPPVTWNGAVSYDLRVDQGKGTARLTEQLVTTRLGMGTYLYQPWLATVGANLGVTYSRAGTSGGLEPDRSDRFLSGGIRLDVFPRSRFPFSVSYDAADSRLDSGNATTLSYRSREIGMTQAYRPAIGNWSTNLTFRRRDQSSDDFGDDSQQSVSADLTAAWTHQNLQVNAADTRAEAKRTDEATHFQTLAARHAYAPINEFNLNNSLNWSRTRNELDLGDTALTVSQWTSLAFWRPRTDWTVTAGARAQALRNDTGADLETRTYNGTLGAAWEATRNLRLAGNAGGTLLDSGTARSKTLTASLAANYQGDTIALGEFNYDWFSGANLNAARGTGRTDNGAAAQIGHNLSRTVRLGDSQAMSLTLGQTLSLQRNSSDESGSDARRSSTRLDTHSAALAWNSSGDGTSHFARLGINDSREIGGSGSRFLLINAQLSGTWEFNRDQNLTGDLTAQRLRQRSGPVDEDAGAGGALPGERLGNNNVAGEVGYNHRRWWGVPRLRFTARLRLARDVQTATQSVVLIPDRETRLAEARTDYRIGRLETSVIARMSEVDGIWRRLLVLRIVRTFGGGQQ